MVEELKNLSEELKKLKGELDEKDQQRQQLEDTLVASELEKEEFKDQVKELKKTKKDIDAKLEAEILLGARRKAELDEKILELEKNNQQLQELREGLAVSEKEKEQYKEENQKLKQENGVYKQEMVKELEKASEESKKIKAELDEKKIDLEKRIQESQHLRETLVASGRKEDYKEDVHNLNQELKKTKTELEAKTVKLELCKRKAKSEVEEAQEQTRIVKQDLEMYKEAKEQIESRLVKWTMMIEEYHRQARPSAPLEQQRRAERQDKSDFKRK